MAVFISVSTNAYAEVFAHQVALGIQQPRDVRRPLVGYEIKDDTYATIHVLSSTQHHIPLIDSSAEDGFGYSYTNMLIMNMSESRAEKNQIVETFGEDYIFFFGERPRMITFSGIVLNTLDFNWKSEFWANYEKTFRGTRLLENDARMYITIDDIIVEGYMMQAQQVGTAQSPYHLPITFQFFVTNYSILSQVGTPFIARHRNAPLNSESDIQRTIYNDAEYVNRIPTTPDTTLDTSPLSAENPQEVESISRNQLDALGVRADDVRSGHLLPGRASFSNSPEYGSFGIQQARRSEPAPSPTGVA